MKMLKPIYERQHFSTEREHRSLRKRFACAIHDSKRSSDNKVSIDGVMFTESIVFYDHDYDSYRNTLLFDRLILPFIGEEQ